jgi:short-subunit dehydrogenase
MYWTTHAFLAGMMDAGSAGIVNVFSAASAIITAPNRFVYGAIKAAPINQTKKRHGRFHHARDRVQLHLP